MNYTKTFREAEKNTMLNKKMGQSTEKSSEVRFSNLNLFDSFFLLKLQGSGHFVLLCTLSPSCSVLVACCQLCLIHSDLALPQPHASVLGLLFLLCRSLSSVYDTGIEKSTCVTWLLPPEQVTMA